MTDTTPTPETARYRRRSAEIEAVQWTDANADELRAFCGPHFDTIDPEDRTEDPDETAAVRTHPHGGWVGLTPGDWVLKHEERRFTALTGEEFADLYEPVPVVSGRAFRDRIASALASATVIGGTPPTRLVPVIDGSNPRMARIADWQPLDGLVDAVVGVLAADNRADELVAARTTNQHLNLRAQRLESELAAYRRAVADWEITETSTYVPLRSLAVIAKAAGLDVPERWELHYERVERAEAELRRLAAETQQSSGPDACSGCRYVPCGNCEVAETQQTQTETLSRQTVEYFVQSQQPDGTWECASSFASAPAFAADRLAARRRMMPDLVLRLAERTTTVVVKALPECLSCRHWSCDGNGPCGALLDAWQRCACDGSAAAPVPVEAAADNEETAAPGKETVECSAVAFRVRHAPHSWEPQPGMDLVRCPGYAASAGVQTDTPA